ncbi:MAG: hypothetical protein OHK0052_25860 [Anaerolineales bacterium]
MVNNSVSKWWETTAKLLLLLLLGALLLPPKNTAAQETQLAFYRVESGDSLWSIARQFGVSVNDLMLANNLSNADQINIGSELMIPGINGISGRLYTVPMPFGETLRSISQHYNLSPAELIRLNRLTTPESLYVGRNLIVRETVQTPISMERLTLAPGGSMLELAAQHDLNPWEIALANSRDPAATPSSQVLLLPPAVTPTTASPGALPSAVHSLEIRGTPVLQGGTIVITIQDNGITAISGKFVDHPLNFFPTEGKFISLQGIHALTPPGFYPLEIEFNLAPNQTVRFSQWVYINDAGYPFDPVLIVDPAVVDPTVTEPETQQVTALTAPVVAQKLWQGAFLSPVDPVFSDCFPSRYGNRRSYNGSPYEYFHTGLDFCGGVGDNIYAPAAGEVIFSGPLTVRGNTTIIHHGWGVYTIYMHQSEILVQTGEQVTAGQKIGLVGATGRVTGPHLHWEIWVNGVQVDPINWLTNTYP